MTIFAQLYILVTGNAEAKRLYDDLMSSYNSLIRPVSNVSERLTVKMGVKLSQLVDVVSHTFLVYVQKQSIICDMTRVTCTLPPYPHSLFFEIITEPEKSNYDDEHVG